RNICHRPHKSFERQHHALFLHQFDLPNPHLLLIAKTKIPIFYLQFDRSNGSEAPQPRLAESAARQVRPFLARRGHHRGAVNSPRLPNPRLLIDQQCIHHRGVVVDSQRVDHRGPVVDSPRVDPPQALHHRGPVVDSPRVDPPQSIHHRGPVVDSPRLHQSGPVVNPTRLHHRGAVLYSPRLHPLQSLRHLGVVVHTRRVHHLGFMDVRSNGAETKVRVQYPKMKVTMIYTDGSDNEGPLLRGKEIKGMFEDLRSVLKAKAKDKQGHP
ncbi:hypothetical protein EJB05_58143, partial [Eragrostis curvula]